MVKYENGVAFLAIVYNIIIGIVTIRLTAQPVVVLAFLFVDFFLIAYYVFFLFEERRKYRGRGGESGGFRRRRR